MLDPDLVIGGLDGRHLRNWWQLGLPPGVQSWPPSYALLVLDEGRLVHAVREGEGALPLDQVPFEGTKHHELLQCRRAMGVDGVIAIERNALASLFHSIERELSLEDPFPSQSVVAWQALRESAGIWTEPGILDLIPPLRVPALQKTFDLLVPDASSLVVYVIDDDEHAVHSSLIAVKEQGMVRLVAMHPAIGDMLSEREIARSWRDNYWRVNDAVKNRFAKPSLSVFVQRRTIDKILSGPADTFSREHRSGNIILDPCPTWLTGLVGGAAVAAAASQTAKRMARFLPSSARKMASDLAGAAQDRLKESSANPFGMLGFDPIELLMRAREFYAPKKRR